MVALVFLICELLSLVGPCTVAVDVEGTRAVVGAGIDVESVKVRIILAESGFGLTGRRAVAPRCRWIWLNVCWYEPGLAMFSKWACRRYNAMSDEVLLAGAWIWLEELWVGGAGCFEAAAA